MKIISLALSTALFFLAAGIALATPPPPKSIELTLCEIRRLQFNYEAWEEGINSRIEIEYPEKIYGTHYPHSIVISQFDLKKKIIAQFRFPASAATRSFSSSFVKKKGDISVSMIYCRIGIESCIDFMIPSATKMTAVAARRDSKPK